MTTMTYKYQWDLREEWTQEGRQEGEAHAILKFLRTRGLTIPQDIEQRIRATTDPALLDTLLARAVTARTAADLFEQDL